MRRRRLVYVACAAVAAVLLASPGAARDLAGTWYVLAHYRDSATANPDAERWEDRIWVFERSGSRMRWIEYPIVVFDNSSGRFERLGTNRAARTLARWEPDESQLGNIRRGLQVNERGKRSKTLRGSDSEGWRSSGASGGFSANTLTYHTIWEVEDPNGLPVFSIRESLGGATAESLDGVTEYRTRSIEPDGSLRGEFNRDATRSGSFWIVRSGGTREVEGSGKTNAERVRELFFGQMGGLGTSLSGERPEGPEADAMRAEARTRIRSQIEENMRSQGMDPSRYQPEIERMSDRILAEWERGESPEQIERMIREGQISGTP